MSEKFAVSRETIRKAIKYLEKQGYLVSHQGRGTFVALNAIRGMQRSVQDLSDEAVHTGQKLLFVGVVVATTSVAQSLNIANGTHVVRIHRIRTLCQILIGIHDAFIAIKHPYHLTEKTLSFWES